MRVSASDLPVHIPGNSLEHGYEYNPEYGFLNSPEHQASPQNIDMHWDFEAHFPNNPFDLSPDKTLSEIDNTLH